VSVLRPITPADHAAVLALNEEFVHLLAPLDEARLRDLVAWSERACVIQLHDDFAGFVLTFATGSPYDGENFGWFTEAYGDVDYLDRIVLAPHARRHGLATAAYDELEAAAAHPTFCLEVNVEPPNEPSLAFHRGRGYVEVGRRREPGHQVSMMAKQLGRLGA
jgi:predicted GNAT superfamily acetyltransferase